MQLEREPVLSVLYFRQVKMPRIQEQTSQAADGTITYRQKYSEGKWWYVELHLKHFGIFGPAALAVVHEWGNGRAEFLSLGVHDSVRRQGYATLLVEAIRNRWPSATWCDTPDSRDFHESLVTRGIARVDERTSYVHSKWYEFVRV